MALYQVLHQWRDTISRQHGLNPSMVIPLDLLVMIAYRIPRSIPELRQLSYILPVFLAAEENLKHLHELMDIVSLVPGDDILPSLPFTTYSEFVKLVQDDTVINKKRVMSSYLNIIRWTLLSSAALGWLTIVLRKNHR
jgi:ribonuclease D